MPNFDQDLWVIDMHKGTILHQHITHHQCWCFTNVTRILFERKAQHGLSDDNGPFAGVRFAERLLGWKTQTSSGCHGESPMKHKSNTGLYSRNLRFVGRNGVVIGHCNNTPTCKMMHCTLLFGNGKRPALNKAHNASAAGSSDSAHEMFVEASQLNQKNIFSHLYLFDLHAQIYILIGLTNLSVWIRFS